MRRYLSIIAASEGYLERYGDTYLGVGWTRGQEEVDRRYRVMLDLIPRTDASRASLLDFGCGASHLYDYMLDHQMPDIEYSGLDLSEKFLDLSRGKHPDITYYEVDVLIDSDALPQFDYVVLNGVFNLRGPLAYDEMLTYFQSVLKAVFPKARKGIAFNVMSKQVDWERDDLFHLPMDVLASFLAKEVSRHFVIRHDYGLYEYTTYVYREPVVGA